MFRTRIFGTAHCSSRLRRSIRTRQSAMQPLLSAAIRTEPRHQAVRHAPARAARLCSIPTAWEKTSSAIPAAPSNRNSPEQSGTTTRVIHDIDRNEGNKAVRDSTHGAEPVESRRPPSLPNHLLYSLLEQFQGQRAETERHVATRAFGQCSHDTRDAALLFIWDQRWSGGLLRRRQVDGRDAFAAQARNRLARRLRLPIDRSPLSVRMGRRASRARPASSRFLHASLPASSRYPAARPPQP